MPDELTYDALAEAEKALTTFRFANPQATDDNVDPIRKALDQQWEAYTRTPRGFRRIAQRDRDQLNEFFAETSKLEDRPDAQEHVEELDALLDAYSKQSAANYDALRLANNLVLQQQKRENLYRLARLKNTEARRFPEAAAFDHLEELDQAIAEGQAEYDKLVPKEKQEEMKAELDAARAEHERKLSGIPPEEREKLEGATQIREEFEAKLERIRAKYEPRRGIFEGWEPADFASVFTLGLADSSADQATNAARRMAAVVEGNSEYVPAQFEADTGTVLNFIRNNPSASLRPTKTAAIVEGLVQSLPHIAVFLAARGLAPRLLGRMGGFLSRAAGMKVESFGAAAKVVGAAAAFGPFAAATAGLPVVIGKYDERRAGVIDIGPTGIQWTPSPETPAKSLLLAYGDVAIEQGTEVLGGAFAFGAKRAATAAVGRLPARAQAGARAVGARIANVLARPAFQAFSKRAQAIGWHGVFAEMSEEAAAEVLHAVMPPQPGDNRPLGQRILDASKIMNPFEEEFLITLGVVGLTGVAAQVPSALARVGQGIGQARQALQFRLLRRPDAAGTGRETEAPGEAEGLGEEAPGGVRLRDVAEPGVEARPGEARIEPRRAPAEEGQAPEAGQVAREDARPAADVTAGVMPGVEVSPTAPATTTAPAPPAVLQPAVPEGRPLPLFQPGKEAPPSVAEAGIRQEIDAITERGREARNRLNAVKNEVTRTAIRRNQLKKQVAQALFIPAPVKARAQRELETAQQELARAMQAQKQAKAERDAIRRELDLARARLKIQQDQEAQARQAARPAPPPAPAAAPAAKRAAKPVAPAVPSPPTARRPSALPAHLRGAKPRYKDKTPRFASDIDLALYIVSKRGKLSKRDNEYFAFLRQALPGRTDAHILELGEAVRATVKQIGERTDPEAKTFKVPAITKTAAAAPAAAPAAKLEALDIATVQLHKARERLAQLRKAKKPTKEAKAAVEKAETRLSELTQGEATELYSGLAVSDKWIKSVALWIRQKAGTAALVDPEAFEYARAQTISATREIRVKRELMRQRTEGWKQTLSNGGVTRMHMGTVLEDIGAFREEIGNLRFRNDTFEKVKARLGKNGGKNWFKVYQDYNIVIEQERQAANATFVKLGIQDQIEYLSMYLPHFYHGVKKPRVGRQRKYQSLAEAETAVTAHLRRQSVAQRAIGVLTRIRPKTQNIAALTLLYTELRARESITLETLAAIGASQDAAGFQLAITSKTMKAVETPGERLYDEEHVREHYRQYLEITHPLITKAMKGKRFFHPDVAPWIRVLLNERYRGKFWHAVEFLNATMKIAEVGFSLFHAIELFFSHAATVGLFTAIKSMPRIATTPAGQRLTNPGETEKIVAWQSPEAVTTAIRAGLQVDPISDVQWGVVSNALNWIKVTTATVPGLNIATKVATGSVTLFNRWLWNVYYTNMKLMAFYQVTEKAMNAELKRDPNVSMERLVQIQEQVAAHLNNAYGGQEWERTILANPKAQQATRWGIFAIDWTLSNLKIANPAQLIQDPLQRSLYLTYWRNMIATLGTTYVLGQYLVYAAFGDDDEHDQPFPWLNEPTEKWAIDVTPIMRALGKQEHKERYYANPGKQVLEIGRYFTRFFDQIIAKSSALVHFMIEAGTILNNSPKFSIFTNPFYDEEGKPLQIAKSFLSRFQPFSLSGNNFALMFTMHKGTSNVELTVAIAQTLKQYAEQGEKPERMGQDAYREKLTDLITDDLYVQAERNGLDVDLALKRAIGMARGHYYGQFFDALLNGNDEDMQDASKKLVMLHSGLLNLMSSMEAKLNLKEKGLEPTPEQYELMRRFTELSEQQLPEEERAARKAEIQRSIASRAKTLARGQPRQGFGLVKDYETRVAEWEEDKVHARAWFKKMGVTRDQALTALVRSGASDESRQSFAHFWNNGETNERP